MTKKGFSPVEWAISISIFILFIAWFFIIAQPILSPTTGSLAHYQVESGLENYLVEIETVPLIFEKNLQSTEPVFVKNPFDEAIKNADRKSETNGDYIYFLYKKNNLIYVSNTTNISVEDYGLNIIATNKSSVTQNFRVDYENFLPTNVRNFISGYNVKVNGVNLTSLPRQTGFYSDDFHSRHSIMTPTVNHSIFVFANNPQMYGLITSENIVEIKIEFELRGPTYYYANNGENGNLPTGGCEKFNADMVWFNNSKFFFPLGNIELCTAASDTLEYTFEGNELLYRIEFNSDNLSKSTGRKNLYKHIFGLVETKRGFTKEKLLEIQNTPQHEFDKIIGSKKNMIRFESPNLVFEKGVIPTQANVFTKKLNYDYFEDLSKTEQVEVTLFQWE